RAKFADRHAGRRDIVHHKATCVLDIEPVEQLVFEIDDQRQKDTICSRYLELQRHCARVEMSSLGTVANHQPGESTSELVEWHSVVIVDHHHGKSNPRRECCTALQVDKLRSSLWPWCIAQVAGASSDHRTRWRLCLQLVVRTNIHVAP